MTEILDGTALNILQVSLRMREADAAEVFACASHDCPVRLASEAAQSPIALVMSRNNDNIAAMGARPIHPGVWTVWMFATDNFPKVALSMTKFVRRVMIPYMEREGVHRAECRSLVTHTEAHRWLLSLGAIQAQDPLRQWGKNREDYYLFYWTRGER